MVTGSLRCGALYHGATRLKIFSPVLFNHFVGAQGRV